MNERIRETPVDAILMGGRDPDSRGLASQYKFLLEVGSEGDILDTTLQAFDDSELVDRVFFVGPTSLIQDRVKGRRKEYVLVEETESFWGNLSAGINRQQQLGHGHEVLIAYSDLPFLQGSSMDWLVTNADQEHGVHLPIVPQATIQKLSPAYQTYYWPMREFPFKWGDNLTFVDINRVPEERMTQLVDEYRSTSDGCEPSVGYFLSTPFRRLALLNKYGGPEAIYTLLLDYASKLLQMRFGLENKVPFSGLREKDNYERLIARIAGVPVELIEAPLIDIVLDVDSQVRLGIFQRGYDQILQTIKNQKAE